MKIEQVLNNKMSYHTQVAQYIKDNPECTAEECRAALGPKVFRKDFFEVSKFEYKRAKINEHVLVIIGEIFHSRDWSNVEEFTKECIARGVTAVHETTIRTAFSKYTAIRKVMVKGL